MSVDDPAPTWRELAERFEYESAALREQVERLTDENGKLSDSLASLMEYTDGRRAALDLAQSENERLRMLLAEAQFTIRSLVGAPEPPGSPFAAVSYPETEQQQ